MKRSLLLIALVALLGASCSDLTTSTDMVFDAKAPPAETFTSIQQEVFDGFCAVSGCHADAEYPNLSARQAYANIVGVRSTQGLKLVAPGQPDSSYLYIKIAGGSGMIGARMPYRRPELPDSTIGAVRRWIEGGAPND
jgi:hypothetical protein